MEIVAGLVVLVLYLTLVSLPGIGISYLGWRLSRQWHIFGQTLFRATLISVTATPSWWGHAGPVPALFLVFWLSGREKLAGIVPIVLVWIVAIPVLGFLAKRWERKQSASTTTLPDQ
jgi:hypothetical protein